MPTSVITTSVPNWGYALEAAVQNEPPFSTISVLVPFETKFLVAAASEYEDFSRPLSKPIIFRREAGETGERFENSEGLFADPEHGILVMMQPNPGRAELLVPINADRPVTTYALFSNYILTSQPVVWQCRTCKLTAKALAAAIAAALLHATLPAAVVGAVASFLGISTLLASEFIKGLAKASFDEIVQRLCEMLGLC